MIERLWYAETQTTEPDRNLALEELFQRKILEGEAILYLWQNAEAVVIGKNQNLFREVRVDAAVEDGCPVVRRRTGGGAVYHDFGNLNFSFVTTRGDYDKAVFFGIIVSALETLGIKAEISGRNDILVDGKKFSGNAFRFDRNSALHHGTIMLRVNVDKFRRYLKTPVKGATPSVSSVQSRVTNLSEFAPDLTVDGLKNALKRAYELRFGLSSEGYVLTSADKREIEEARKSYVALGGAADCEKDREYRFPWGSVALHEEAGGSVLFSDSLYPAAIDWANDFLASGNEGKIPQNPHFDRTENAILEDINNFLGR